MGFWLWTPHTEEPVPESVGEPKNQGAAFFLHNSRGYTSETGDIRETRYTRDTGHVKHEDSLEHDKYDTGVIRSNVCQRFLGILMDVQIHEIRDTRQMTA